MGINLNVQSLKVEERPFKQNSFKLSFESRSVPWFLERGVGDCSTQKVLHRKSFSHRIWYVSLEWSLIFAGTGRAQLTSTGLQICCGSDFYQWGRMLLVLCVFCAWVDKVWRWYDIVLATSELVEVLRWHGLVVQWRSPDEQPHFVLAGVEQLRILAAAKTALQ